MQATLLDPSEHNPYYQLYIKQFQGNSLLEGLTKGMESTVAYFQSLPKEKLEYAYAPNKWTPKEILLHLIDCERVFAYRALHFSRASKVVLPGFDQDEFASNVDGNSRSLENLLDEYKAVRHASIHFVRNCSEEALVRKGEASGSTLSVRAAFYITCGHEIHHCKVITERYL